MKTTNLKRRLLSAALAALMLASTLAACGRSKQPPATETTRETESGSLTVTETLPETDPEKDPFAEALCFVKDGKTAYRIVVPDYAAAWEQKAAGQLSDLIRHKGAEVEIVTDRASERGEKEIVVGYTNRGDVLPEDFFAVGENGFRILVVNESLYIGANSADGMEAALGKIQANLMEEENRMGISKSYACKAVDEQKQPPVYELAGPYAGTIDFSRRAANVAQAHYPVPNRQSFRMQNRNMTIDAYLTQKGQGKISRLENAHGIPYLRDTMTPYMFAEDGTVFTTENTSTSAYANIFLYGAYYYKSQVLNTNFGSPDVIKEGKVIDLLDRARSFTGHDIDQVKKDQDGALHYVITSTGDPYLNIGKNLNAPAAYNAVQLTIRTTDSSNGQFYLAAGSHGGIDGSQIVEFKLIPDGEYHTYVFRLDGVKDYTNKLNHLRMDLGAKVGEEIAIKECKLVQVENNPHVPKFALDRTWHTYADKLNQELRFVAVSAGEHLGGYGMLTEIDKNRVHDLLIIDGQGEHHGLDGVDWGTATAVAFDIDRAGVFGYLLTADPHSGILTVTEKDGLYIIDQRVSAPAAYPDKVEYRMGHRLYTDETHSFDGVRKAAFEEQHPLTGLKVAGKDFSQQYLGYNPLSGSYEFSLRGSDFNTAFHREPDVHYRADLSITGAGDDRDIYISTLTNAGGLECAVVLDRENRVLPMMVQVSKNFHGEMEEPRFNYNDPAYGNCYLPVSVKAGQTLELSVLNLYQNWGKFPLKQISSIQFFSPYYHLSTGVTETNCIAPYFVGGKDHWTLPDFRSMSAPLWAGQPQHTSAGRLFFLEYTDAEGHSCASEDTVDRIDSHGPVYADIDMDYISDDQRIAVTYRHMEMPQTDENRTYYEVHMKVLEDIHIRDFMHDFAFFSMDGRSIAYEQLGYLDENNEAQIIEPSKDAAHPHEIKLGKQSPYFAYAYCGASKDYVNMAMVLKDWHIVLNGQTYEDHLMIVDRHEGAVNRLSLTLNLGETTLKAGDELNFAFVLMPWGSQLTAKGDFSNVQQVRKDTGLDPIRAEVKTGTLIPDAYMPKIRVSDGTAAFTLSGGENHMAVRVYGLKAYEKPVIEEYVNGAWVAYDTASKNGYDGYMVYYDGDGTYSCAFIVPMTDGAPRTFRVRG